MIMYIEILGNGKVSLIMKDYVEESIISLRESLVTKV